MRMAEGLQGALECCPKKNKTLTMRAEVLPRNCSDYKGSLREIVGRIFVAVAIFLAGATVIAAQQKQFDPQLSVGLFRTSNVAFVGDGPSDTGLRLGLTLPVSRPLQNGSLAFRYSAGYQIYDRSTTLDNLSHRVSLAVSKSPSRNTSFGVQAGYIRTQEQGLADSLEETDLFLSQRSERETINFGLSLSSKISTRWEWSLSAGYLDWGFDPIEDFESESSEVALEDRTALSGSFTFARLLSETSALGFSLGYSQFDLEFSGEQDTQMASLVYSRELGERLSLSISAGGFVSSGTALEDVDEGSSDSRSGFQGTLNLSRSLKRVSLSLFAGHMPSAGNDRPGTSVNTIVGVSVSSESARRWNWGVFARYAYRDPNDPTESSLETFALGADVGFVFGRSLSLQLGVNYTDQFGEGAEGEGSYVGAQVSLVWHPLARTRLAGG